MVELPQTKEIIIHVPQAMQRYFYELVAGGACIIVSTIIALTMMYQVLDQDQPEAIRLIYFLVIALSLGVLIIGFRVVVDSESERKLAAKYNNHEWIMDEKFLSVSLALLEGRERAVLRKFKTGAVRVEWEDIQKIVLAEAIKPPKAQPACLEIYVENHEMTLGEGAILRIRRDLLATQEERILAFCKTHGVKIEVPPAPAATAPATNLSSLSAG